MSYFERIIKEDVGGAVEKVTQKPVGHIYMGYGLGNWVEGFNIGPVPLYFRLDIVTVADMEETANIVRTPIPNKKGEHISFMGTNSRDFRVGCILSGTVKYYSADGSVIESVTKSAENQQAILAAIRTFWDNGMPIIYKFGNIHTAIALIVNMNTAMIPGQPYDVGVLMDIVEYFRVPMWSTPIGQHVLNFNYTSPF